MNPLTREWVQKAEGDFATATREIRARKSPNYDSACFHSQQCAEKYFKARLQEAGIAFPYTHDLEVLLRLVLKVEPLWAVLSSSAQSLTEHAVKSRYPGAWVTRDQAKDAFARCRDIRRLIRHSLGLKR
jgi:HEPN domain-containing protein